MKMKVVKTEKEAMKYCAYGMGALKVTKEQIKELLKGNILVDETPDEYGTMIVLDNESN